MARPRPLVRVKLAEIGKEITLFIRFNRMAPRERMNLEQGLRQAVADCRSDGEVQWVSGQPGIEAAWAFIAAECDAAYDLNLERERVGRPCPWPIPLVPLRDWRKKLPTEMARVYHPDLGESLAFLSPRYDDDFMIDFKRALAGLERWYRCRRDLERRAVWIVAEAYAGRVHEVLDQYFHCRWDEFMAGDEWDVLPPPASTTYPTRTLTREDFLTLDVAPDDDIAEINLAYREKKEAYRDNRLSVDEWLDIDLAYQRIRRHHLPEHNASTSVVLAPREILRLLQENFPRPADQARWYHSFNHNLNGVPAHLVESRAGCDTVARYLELTGMLGQASATHH
jgi:hypothetical protein